MHPTGSDQTAKSHPQVEEHNAKTKTATNNYNRNARDLPSLKTGRPVYMQLVPRIRNWIPGHIIKRLSQRTYKIKTYNGGIYVRNRKFIKPRYVDSKVYTLITDQQ